MADFLKDTYYKGHYEINTKGRTDLVVHNGKSASDTVGVIIETKKPPNKHEMIAKSCAKRTPVLAESGRQFLSKADINSC